MKRPRTVWLTQALLIFFAGLFLLGLLINLARLGRLGEGASGIGAARGASLILGLVLLLLVAFWGLAKRKMYGRWLGLVSLFLLWGIFSVIQYYPPAGPWKRYEYNSTAQLIGAGIFHACVHVLFLVLILRLSFARKVVGFFRDA